LAISQFSLSGDRGAQQLPEAPFCSFHMASRVSSAL